MRKCCRIVLRSRSTTAELTALTAKKSTAVGNSDHKEREADLDNIASSCYEGGEQPTKFASDDSPLAIDPMVTRLMRIFANIAVV